MYNLDAKHNENDYSENGYGYISVENKGMETNERMLKVHSK